MNIKARPRSPLVDRPELAALAAEILKAVAHPLRLQIVDVLTQEKLHVGALAERLDARQPIVSQQLRILRMQRLVRARRDGGLVVYELAQPELRKLVSCMKCCLPSGGTRQGSDGTETS
jgi:ArsR family transcriptional regulator